MHSCGSIWVKCSGIWAFDPFLASHAFPVAFSALPVGRIAEHEVKLAGREGIVQQGGVLRPPDDVVRRVAISLDQQIRLTDGIGLGVNLLAMEMGSRLFVLRCGEFL